MTKIIASMAFCVIAIVMFVATATISRRVLPVGLLHVYGDTSGIHNLSIIGSVSSWGGDYAYTFNISPEGASTNMMIFRNANDFRNFERVYTTWWMSPFWNFHDYWRRIMFAPVGPYEITQSLSQHSFTRAPGGEFVPMVEYRVYGEIFRVIPLYSSAKLYVPDGTVDGLYIDFGPDGFIRGHSPEDSLMHFSAGATLPRSPGFELPSELRLTNTNIFVPTGPGLFGQTAVYAVRWSEESPFSIHRYPYDENVVNAEILFPIQLEKGVDEIIGLLQHSANDALLFIRRATGLEITRICTQSGEARTVLVEGHGTGNSVAFDVFQLQEDSLVLRGSNAVAIIDLRNGGLAVTGEFIANLGFGMHEETITSNVHDMLYKDGVFYIAYTAASHPWGELPIVGSSLFISAFDATGQIIGRSQVLSGAEDDRFWLWESSSRDFFGGSQATSRNIRMLSISVSEGGVE